MRTRLILGGLALSGLAAGLFVLLAGGGALAPAALILAAVGGVGLFGVGYLGAIGALNAATRRHIRESSALKRIGLVAAFPLVTAATGAGLGVLSRYVGPREAVICFFAGLALVVVSILWSTWLRLVELRTLRALKALGDDV